MAIRKAHYSLAFLVIFFVVSNSQTVCNPEYKAKEPFNCDNSLTFNRTGFPENFTFGAATAAYQAPVHWIPLLLEIEDVKGEQAIQDSQKHLALQMLDPNCI
ncbi:hypothetical protein Rs2_39197 [Raphanus sativus]|nr:hypothetical protein Rs2_39197 [Raphanus sativus]